MLLTMLPMLMLPGVVSPSHARTTPIVIANSLAPSIVWIIAMDAANMLLIVLHARGILAGRWDLLLGLSTLNG